MRGPHRDLRRHVDEKEVVVNTLKICVRVECVTCEESLLVWVQPIICDVVVGFERQSFYSDEQHPVMRDDALLLRRNEIVDAALDEGWAHHYRGSGGVICQKCTGK